MKSSAPYNLFYFFYQGFFFLCILFIIGIVIIGIIPIKHHLITKYAISYIDNLGIDSCLIESVEIAALRSVRLNQLYLKSDIDTSLSFEASINTLTINVNVIQFFLNKNHISTAFSKLHSTLNNHSTSISRTIAKTIITLNNHFNGLHASTDNVILEVTDKNKVIFSGTNGTLALSSIDSKNQDMLLEIDFPIITSFGEGVQDLHGFIMLTSDGQLSISDLSARYCKGTIKANGNFSLFEDSIPTSYNIKASKIDFAYWYAMHIGIGKIDGKATIALHTEDQPLHTVLNTLSLSATIANCSVEKLPLQESLATSLFLPALSSLKFKKVIIQIQNGLSDTIISSFKGNGDDLNFFSKGWISSNGSLHQSINGALMFKTIKSLPPVIQKNLQLGNDNTWKFSCKLFGTYTDPRFELDTETLQRAIGGVFSIYQKNILDILMK